jgi:hypothetical protein
MCFKTGIIASLVLLTMLLRAGAAAFWQTGNLLVMSNANARLEYNLNAGTTAFFLEKFPDHFRLLQSSVERKRQQPSMGHRNFSELGQPGQQFGDCVQFRRCNRFPN